MSVRAVVLDMGMTVVRADPSYVDVFVEGCARAGLDLSDRAPAGSEGGFSGFGDVWREHNEAWEATGRPSPHVGDAEAERDFWISLYRRLLGLLEVEDGDLEAVATAVFEHFQRPTSFAPYPDVAAALDELDSRGVRLAVCSNWGPALRDLLDHHGLLRRFDAVAISGEVGHAKPDHELFRAALDGLGDAPGPHVVHVGDDLDHDIAPARQLGMQTVLMDRYDRHPHHAGPRVRSLAELIDLLDLPAPERLDETA